MSAGMPASTKRDNVADIAKGIGILFVIAGHCQFDLPDFLTYSFHMPLFFFIAGFFIQSFILDKTIHCLAFLKKRFTRLMLPFFIYNLIFGLLSWLSQFIGLRLASGPFELVLSPHNLFVAPFLDNHQYLLSCPLWFVPALFCALCMAALFRPILRACHYKLAYKLAFIALLACAYYICARINPHVPYNGRFLARNIIAFIYLCLGFFYYASPLRQCKPHIPLIAGLIIYYSILYCYGHVHFSMFNNDYGTGRMAWASLPTALAGIAIIIGFSGLIAGSQGFVKADGFIRLGQSTYHIMAIHLSCFLLLNCLLCLILNYPFSIIDSPYFRFRKMIPLYFIFGVAGSWWYVKKIDGIKAMPWKKLIFFWSSDPASKPEKQRQ